MYDGLNSIAGKIYSLLIVFLMSACGQLEEHAAPVLLQLMPSEKTGINFQNNVVETLNENVFAYINHYNGGGVSTGDINNDGLVDIYFSANSTTGKLYLNKGGFEFEDITSGSGLDTLSGWKTGVVMVDINQDGLLDLYLCRAGWHTPKYRKNLLFINNGDLTFSEKGREYGLDDSGYSTHASFFDYDLDGDLDMYLLNHSLNPSRAINIDYGDEDIDANIGDKLYKNTGGVYSDVTSYAGIKQSKLGDGLGVSIGDFNNDLFPDIYVCNDFIGRDYLYINNGDGTFKENAFEALNHISLLSMGADIADIDNDGWQDLFVLDMRPSNNYRRKVNMTMMSQKVFSDLVMLGGHHQYMINTMQLNNGNGTFSDIGFLAGVSSTDWSWGPLFVDLDNDGLKDLLITNGMKKNTNDKDFDMYRGKRTKQEFSKQNPNFESMIFELLGNVPEENVMNQVYKNIDGLSFDNNTEKWGITMPSFSSGVAYADLDNDGDMDLIINNVDQKAHVYRNNVTNLNGNHYLKIKLNGSLSNLNGIGAKVMIQTGGEKQFLEQYVSRGYQSSVDFTLHFGLGKATLVDNLTVIWPDGKVSKSENIEVDKMITIDHRSAFSREAKEDSKQLLFSEVTDTFGLKHLHIENTYNDFEKEVLLPHKMSTLGPALAIGDINQDGLEDFFIGGSMDQEGSLYIQNDNATFSKTKQSEIILDKYQEDIDACFFDADGDGDLDLYVVSGGNELPEGNEYYQDRLYLNNGSGSFAKSNNALPQIKSSGGVVRSYDFDGDGDLDLFVGGRQLPGKYPRTGRSYLLENDAGILKDVTSIHSHALEYPGMVTDALWSDFDGDGSKDLILVGEWMPVTIFKNKNGTLTKYNEDSTLSNSQGWWFSIAEGDVNMDGRMDYIVGNLGENYNYQSRPGAPFSMFSKDFDNNGSLDIVLGYYEEDILYPLKGKDLSSLQIPGLMKKYKDFHSFGLATLEDVYDVESLKKADLFEAKTFSNSIFINYKEGFEMMKLPKIAQISAVFGIVYDDFDEDGFKDIIIAGNLYNSEVETPRNDAGNGMFLKGNGKGDFIPARGYESGLFIPGDVKKLKAIKLGDSNIKGIISGINNDLVRLIVAQ